MEKLVAAEFEGYFDFLRKYRDELKAALENEREKRRSLLESNMERLESVLSMQQAQTMKLRSLEAKRVELQGAFGDGDITAAEFVSKITDERTKAAFTEVIKEMSQLSLDIKEQNAKALEIAKTNLKLLESIFSSGGLSQSKTTYDPKGGRHADEDAHSVELKF